MKTKARIVRRSPQVQVSLSIAGKKGYSECYLHGPEFSAGDSVSATVRFRERFKNWERQATTRLDLTVRGGEHDGKPMHLYVPRNHPIGKMTPGHMLTLQCPA